MIVKVDQVYRAEGRVYLIDGRLRKIDSNRLIDTFEVERT